MGLAFKGQHSLADGCVPGLVLPMKLVLKGLASPHLLDGALRWGRPTMWVAGRSQRRCLCPHLANLEPALQTSSHSAFPLLRRGLPHLQCKTAEEPVVLQTENGPQNSPNAPPHPTKEQRSACSCVPPPLRRHCFSPSAGPCPLAGDMHVRPEASVLGPVTVSFKKNFFSVAKRDWLRAPSSSAGCLKLEAC